MVGAEAPLGLGAAANKRSPILRDLFGFFVCFVLVGRCHSDDASVERGEFVCGHFRFSFVAVDINIRIFCIHARGLAKLICLIYMRRMENLHIEIIKQAGGVKAVAERLNVGGPAITLAQRAQSFPASWFDALEELTGAALDRSLFKFK